MDEARLQEIEIKLTLQEKTIKEPNDELYEHSKKIDCVLPSILGLDF
ncbi:MAG: SlyX family protein [Pseudomonadota bacterium]